MHKHKSVKPVQRPIPAIIVTEPSTSASATNMELKRYFVNNNQRPSDNQDVKDVANDQLNRAKTSPMRLHANYVDSNTETSDGTSRSVDTVDLCEKNDEPTPFSKRKKLGILPSFIPID